MRRFHIAKQLALGVALAGICASAQATPRDPRLTHPRDARIIPKSREARIVPKSRDFH
mgnify:CR=1 FL=1